jgi:hypothetical protein
MRRQLVIASLTLFLFIAAEAKNSENQTFIVPSPQSEKPVEPKVQPKPGNVSENIEAQGLDTNSVAQAPVKNQKYHLFPSDSVTLAFSLVDDLSKKDSSMWFGAHYAPWMDATNRVQVGLDLHDKTGLLQAAYHSLHSRTLSRYYWGGGLSMRIDSEEKLSNIVETENYYLFVTGGWDFQIAWRHSLRAEVSFHQGTEDHFIKGLGGYTYHF